MHIHSDYYFNLFSLHAITFSILLVFPFFVLLGVACGLLLLFVSFFTGEVERKDTDTDYFTWTSFNGSCVLPWFHGQGIFC